MNTPDETKKWFTWQNAVSIAGFTLSLGTFLVGILTYYIPKEIVWGAGLVFCACTICVKYRWIKSIAKRLQPYLVTTAPWLVVVVLILSALTLYHILPSKKAVLIGFDPGKCAVFNSWQHQPTHSKFLVAFGVTEPLAWGFADNGSIGVFQYRTDPLIQPAPGPSSGGYITFYNDKCDRLQFRKLFFRCKATEVTGIPDVGIRLAVDNPRLSQDREMSAYEIESLRNYGTVDGSWHSFEVPLSDFKQVRNEPPFPPGLDENTINKIVFFVDSRIGQRAAKATLWFSDIKFEQ